LDLVQVHPITRHLHEPPEPPSQVEKTFFIPSTEVTRCQNTEALIRFFKICARCGVAHHYVRPAVDELARPSVDVESPTENGDADAADLFSQTLRRDVADAGRGLSLSVHHEKEPALHLA